MKSSIVKSFILALSLIFIVKGTVHALNDRPAHNESNSPLKAKEFFKPELYISSSNVPLDKIRDHMPNIHALV